MAELGIEGGTLVTSAGKRAGNLYVRDGSVAEFTAEFRPAAERFDASGLLVMPGMVDAHVHSMDPADLEREDFPSATAAAIRSGVTTIIEHTHASPVRTGPDLAAKVTYLASRACADFALGAHAWPGQVAAATEVWRAGAAFLKAFTCTTHGVPGHDAAALRELMVAACGADATCLLHCEDESLTAAAETRLKAAGRRDGGVIPEWRSPEAEMIAVSTAAILARESGGRVVLAHASSREIVDAAGGLMIETCPQYLTLREAEVLSEGALRKFTPPARARAENDLLAMWKALSSGRIDYVSSDHAPSTRAQKEAGSIWDVHFGLPGIDTTFSVLLDGAARGRLSYERVVEVYSEAPARIYGLRGKGTLEPGADADLVLVDPGLEWTVRDEDVISKAGWSPFSGRTLRGRAVRTYLRGTLAAHRGKVLAEPGAGRFLPGPGGR